VWRSAVFGGARKVDGVRADDTIAHIDALWSEDIVPALQRYIAIPNVSPAFDADWMANGHMAEAVELISQWCRTRPIAGMTVEVHELTGLTPVVVCEIPAFGDGDPDDTVILYGHLDKQPEMTGWNEGLGPWTPVIIGERLYGRGGADDGYAAFGALAAIEALQATGGSHPRCIVLIEASEESGSPDLAAHVDALLPRLGSARLVLCLDSGCLDYERLWVTTSLRGLAGGTLTVEILEEGVHSGSAGGIVADTFRIARRLLARVEDDNSGEILLDACHVEVPEDRRREADGTALLLVRPPSAEFPFVTGASPVSPDPVEQLLERTWAPQLAVVGADGLPPTGRAGNVLRPSTSLRLSMRLPPTCDADRALAAMTEVLTADPPYGARVRLDRTESATGWNSPSFAPWLRDALDEASQRCFGAAAEAFGEGGSIPFMGMLGERFPEAQFVVTGVLGPHSNAHGPNEFLDLPTARRVTAVLALVLDAAATGRTGRRQ
jgi:acetylornithine deacetylase/succinyl-diaminopimelate desuccinylase-like protein